ncbi:MAG: T9SS type A sorting domain-containing protein [Candidatus Stahlbacteria bacterium]|nr:T9SS type A sorting domain-containing protein [Candidatus Stahlbacteria bacterium]
MISLLKLFLCLLSYDEPAKIDSLNMQCVGMWPFGWSYTVWKYDTICYLGSGGGVYVLNVANPTAPKKISEIVTSGFVESFFGTQSTLYIADGERGVRIINISNPVAPSEIGFYDTPGYAQGIYCVGSFGYIADRTGLRIADISNPAYPLPVGYYDTPGLSMDVAVCLPYAYIADGDKGLCIVYVGTPDSPTLAGSYDTPGFARGVYCNGRYVYIADGDSGLCILDVLDHANPILAYRYKNIGYTYSVSAGVDTNIIYVAAGLFLHILDVGNPYSPTSVGVYPLATQPTDICIDQNISYVSSIMGEGLNVIDISVPNSPTLIGYYKTPDHSHSITCDDSTAYIATGGSGIYVLDITHPNLPVEIGNYDTPGYAVDIYSNEGYAYISSKWEGGLRILDVRKPDSIKEAAYYDPSRWHWTEGIEASSYLNTQLLYIANGDSGLRVMKICSPTVLHEVGYSKTKGYAIDVCADSSRGIVYVANGDSGVQIFALSDWFEPQEIARIGIQGSARSVYYIDSLLLITAWTNGVYIYDVSNPGSPLFISRYITDGFACGVSGNKRNIYVANGNSGIIVVNIVDPAHPYKIGQYPATRWISAVHYDSPYVYVTDNEAGIKILKLIDSGQEEWPDKGNFILFQNSPNPFKHSTTIRFKIRHEGLVFINIYDLTGRIIRKLLHSSIMSGLHTIEWNGTGDDGKDVAPGIYFCRISSDINIDFQIKKMILIR